MSTTARDTHAHLRKALEDALLTEEPLRQHTTFRIGGPADWFVAAHTPEVLIAGLWAAHELGIPAHLIGGGSNLLVSDAGLRGLVVKNAIDEVEFDGTVAHVGCGADYLEFLERCCALGLAGLTYAAGIPGSVGGAIYGNAGCYGQDIGSRIIECTIATPDGRKVETRPREWCQFAYR